MRSVDLSTTPFRFDDSDLRGFRAGAVRPGPDLGARHSGVTYYELPPGEAVCPLHYECGEEEWAIALDGPMWVRDDDGVHRVEPMTLVFFPRGPEGVHQVRNDGDATVHVLMFGETGDIGASVYPDSDKIGVWTPHSNGIFERSATVGYYHGESPR